MENSITNIAKGVGIALLTTFILLLLLATVLTYTETSETIINPVIIVITAISILNWRFSLEIQSIIMIIIGMIFGILGGIIGVNKK